MDPFTPTIADIKNCDISSWYNSLKNFTIKTEFIEIPDNVLTYLRDGGPLFLPKIHDQFLTLSEKAEKSKKQQLKNKRKNRKNECVNGSKNKFDFITDDDSWASDSSDSTDEDDFSFPEFDENIFRAMEKVSPGTRTTVSSTNNQGVFIKLNWSSPSDAYCSLSSNNRGQVFTIRQIYLLLKSSDRIIHDLDRPFIYSSEALKNTTSNSTPNILKSETQAHKPILTIKSYLPAAISSGEYRCFIRDGRLLCACQRDKSTHFPYMEKDSKSIAKLISLFISEKVIQNTEKTLKNFVCDIQGPWSHTDVADVLASTISQSENGNEYQKLSSKSNLKLLEKFFIVIDLNPFSNGHTNSIFFDWSQELLNLNVRNFWESEELQLTGVKQEKMYDWLGFCGILRVRSGENF